MIAFIRKTAALLLVLLMLFSAGGAAMAAEQEPVTAPSGNMGIMWVNTSTLYVTLSFSGSQAVCGAYVLGVSGTTEISGSATLARKNSNGTYTTVKTWNNLYAADDILTFDGSWYVTTGYTYKLTFTATVYRNGVGETVSEYYEAEA
jgi:4-aminobutyrate aminotransferase-like enzyme